MIEITNLRMVYPNGFEALRGITTSIPMGSIALVGPNGAGKSTLLKIMMAILRPTEGSVRIFGMDSWVDRMQLRLKIGYMPEYGAFYPEMTGYDFILLMTRALGIPSDLAHHRTFDSLQYVRLGEVAHRKIKEYSQGMKQKLKLALALVHDPNLLILDEPTAGLDPSSRTEMLRLIKDLVHRHGKNVLVSTHLLPDVEEICSHLITINEGRIVTTGSIDEILGKVEYFYRIGVKTKENEMVNALKERGITAELLPGGEIVVHGSGAEVANEIFQVAYETNIPLRYLTPDRKHLQEIFSELVITKMTKT